MEAVPCFAFTSRKRCYRVGPPGLWAGTSGACESLISSACIPRMVAKISALPRAAFKTTWAIKAGASVVPRHAVVTARARSRLTSTRTGSRLLWRGPRRELGTTNAVEPRKSYLGRADDTKDHLPLMHEHAVKNFWASVLTISDTHGWQLSAEEIFPCAGKAAKRPKSVQALLARDRNPARKHGHVRRGAGMKPCSMRPLTQGRVACWSISHLNPHE